MTFSEQDFAAPQQFTESDFADAGPFTEQDFEEAPAQQDFWKNPELLQRWKTDEDQRQALSGFYDPGTEFTSAIANDPFGFAMSPLTIAGDVLNAAASDVGATVGTFAAGEPGQAGVQGGNLYEYFNKDREGPLPQERVLADVAQDNPALATTGKIAAGLVKSAPMLALMPQGALGKLVAAGFTADMISHAGDAATRLGTEMGKPEDERDADALTTALSDIIQSAAFAPLTGAHAGGKVIGERVAPKREAIRELANALKSKALDAARTTPKPIRELGIPQASLTAEPFLQPGVRELADAALREAQQRIVVPGREGVAAGELRRAVEPPQIDPVTIATAERIQGGGEAPYGKASFMREAEAPTVERTQAAREEPSVNAPKDRVSAEPLKEAAPLPPEIVADSDLRVSVQSPMKMGAKEVPGYVQVDSMVGGQNQWSSNPAALKKQGYDIPTEAELQTLPQGQYTLAEAKAKLAEMNAPEAVKVDAINRLQPAVLIDGKPALGKSHIEAALEVGTPEAIEAASKPENQGFVFDGNFISREQAAQMVGEKGKLTSERLTELRENLRKPAPAAAKPIEVISPYTDKPVTASDFPGAKEWESHAQNIGPSEWNSAEGLKGYLADLKHDSKLGIDNSHDLRLIADVEQRISELSKPTPAAPGAEAKPPTQTAGERKASIRAKLNRKGEAGFVNAEILGELIGYGKQVYEKGMTAGKWVAHAVAEFGERVRQLAIKAWETIKSAYENSGLADETGAVSAGGGGARRKGKKPTLSQPGTALTDKVEMRTLSERATTSEKIPEPVQEKIESAPESYYQVQSLKGVEQASKAKSDAELGATSKDSDAYTSDKLELSTRLLNAGKHEEGYRVFQDLSADLTRMGQVINQAKLFQALRPEHVVTVVNKELVKGGRDPLTVEQSARVEAAAQGRITKQAELERATDEWVKNPTDSNAATAETALSDANKAAVNEQSLVNQFKPRTTSSVLKSVLQGNLLTPISQVANLVGNVSFIPFRAGTRATATAIDMLDAAIRNRPRQVSAAPIGGTKAAVAGLIQGAKQIPSILVRGTGETIKGEPRAGLHPMRAWVKQFAKNPDVPTVGGKIPFSERINLAIEGTFGVPAEIMLRGLGSGDAPFRGAARGRLISEASRLQKLKPSDQRMAQRFPELFFDKATLERIDSEGRAAIFQRHSSTIDRIMELARSRGDLMDFAIATVAPYKLTPWNIVGEILSYNPLIATARSGIEARRGNVRGAEMNAGKALVGGMTIYAGYWLYENGLLSPSLDSRDEQQKARMLAGEVMPPNHINVSGLKRKLAGGDPAFKSGDETVDIFRGGGLAGSLFYMVANIGRDAETSPPGDEMLLSVLKNSTLEQARFGVNQSFLKGVTGLLDAVRYGETDNYIQSYAGTILSIPLPNTLSALSRAQRPYKVDASDPKFTKQLENIVRTRLGFAGLDDYLPLKRGLWGEPLPETPTNANALVYHFFDISKNKQVTSDPVPLELYRLWRKTASSSVIPTPPEKSITADRETRVLTPAQHSRYAELVGSARRDIIGRIVANPEWHQIPDEGKMNILEKVYRSGLERGKEEFMIEAWDKLEAKPAKAGFK